MDERWKKKILVLKVKIFQKEKNKKFVTNCGWINAGMNGMFNKDEKI